MTTDSFQVAQTNLQLYNQLLRQMRSPDDLASVRSAYELASLLYSGHYQADGKPFVCHTVGVASILAELEAPAPVLAFALVHNVYSNGDFGDGKYGVATPFRRRKVRDAVGAEVEALVDRFRGLRITGRTIGQIEERLGSYDETERWLLLADLADHLEKYVDHGVLYFGDGSWITDEVGAFGERMTMLAERLDQPALAVMMRDAFASAAASPPVPPALRGKTGQKYLALTMPLSATRRLPPRLVAWWRRKRRRKRPS